MGYYGLGCKLGKTINENYWGKKEKKESKIDNEQRKYNNAYITLHGVDKFHELTDHEKQSRGKWD